MLELLARLGPLSHREVARAKCQQWILVACRCGQGQKLMLFLKKTKNVLLLGGKLLKVKNKNKYHSADTKAAHDSQGKAAHQGLSPFTKKLLFWSVFKYLKLRISKESYVKQYNYFKVHFMIS